MELSRVIRGCTLAILFAMAATAHAELVCESVETTSSGKHAGVVVGNVKTVLDGNSTGALLLTVKPGKFAMALGAASLSSDAAGQGETLVVGERCLVKSVDAGENYRTTSTVSAPFWSGFVAGIPSALRPSAQYKLANGESIESIYGQLAKRHGPLLAVIGKGHFARIETSAVKLAPCYGEPIFGANKTKYFHPSSVLPDVDALFFGLMLRSAADATTGTQRVFYVNPDDRGSSAVLSHSHFATLRKPEPGISRVSVDSLADEASPYIEEVAHMLTQSVMTSGELEVYELVDVAGEE